MLNDFLIRLLSIKKLSFTAKLTRDGKLETKTGKGDVVVSNPKANIVVFQEKGLWLEDQTAFSNTLRWTLDPITNRIGLEHLRYGLAHPVFLFHMELTKPFVFESVEGHVCGKDTYLGNLTWNQSAIHFRWSVIGPAKNDKLIYQYND